MKLMYGSTQIGDANSVQIVPRRELLRNAAGIGYRFKHSVDVVGAFTFNGPAECTLRMTEIEEGLMVQDQDLSFLYDDNSNTIHAWVSEDTFSGIRCTGLIWLGSPGGQFATWRSFSTSFEFETEIPDGMPALIDFKETLMIDNQPPVYVGIESINDTDALFFPTVQRPIRRASQSGFAVGLDEYPDVAAIAPMIYSPNGTSIILRSKTINKVSPNRVGLGSHSHYQIEWSYQFESNADFTAEVPNIWTG